ncbi:MAG: hypothetical protein AAF125_12970, partial [Chloroflexota bacterium]
VAEAYATLDIDDDGRAELVRVWCSVEGSNILEWEGGKQAVEEVSHIPFAALTPYIIPHRHIGRAVVEIVDDIQRVKTVLMRHMLDNVYATNYRRPHFDENLASEHTYDDLMNPDHGTPIRTGGAQIEYSDPPFMAGGLLPFLEKFDALQESRTGATRYNQGLDAESLNKTASGIAQIRSDGLKKIKLIARTLAETGIRDLMLGIHRDLRQGPMKQMVLRLRGKWVAVDPRTWRQRSEMRVTVGMGRGDEDQRRQGLMMVIQGQEKLIASGSRMVGEQQLFNAIEDAAETFGLQHIEKYIANPATLGPPPPPPPPQPDPIMISAQAQAQKVQLDAQNKQAEIQAGLQKAQAEYALKMRELETREADVSNKVQTDDEKMEIERKKLELDALKANIDKQRLELDNHHRNEDRRSQNNDALVSAGLPPDYSFNDDREQFKAITEMMAQNAENQRAMMQAVTDGQAMLSQGQQALAESIKGLSEATMKPRTTEITLSDGRTIKGTQKLQ